MLEFALVAPIFFFLMFGLIELGRAVYYIQILDSAARDAQAFGADVGRATGRPVEYWDERLTTVAAERYLIAQGKRRARRRDDVDRMAATLLLQGYLDYRGSRGTGG